MLSSLHALAGEEAAVAGAQAGIVWLIHFVQALGKAHAGLNSGKIGEISLWPAELVQVSQVTPM